VVHIAANSAVVCTQSLVVITCRPISISIGEKDHVAEKLNSRNFA